ncbi:hypothetical protein IMZ31_21550 (plasmid) [Pontibacillus sp. ALD_SL1]|uniref:tetratricopeptide repeat protein n=1 Tax=Pontibacillus sp. ALD_SL1 TaxID=2777185 RepID=UPI001A9795C0|nr:hypothetical protein [Pontibacillus sp. ALD_SL1]QST02038.1 hypothetical protein IMZ31_21550 [Pontibacillus sp. ALD_SL1]
MRKATAVLLTFCLFLAACGSKEMEQYVTQGDKALAEEKYDDAISFYMKALQLDSKNPDTAGKLREARGKKKEEVLAAASESYSAMNYTEAERLYTQLNELPNLTEVEKEEAELKLEEVSLLKEKQISFNQYIDWSTPTVKDYYKIASEWERLSSSFGISAISNEEMKKGVTQIAGEMNVIKASIDTKAFDIEDTTLLDVHKGLSDVAERHAKGFVNVVRAVNQIKEGTDMNVHENDNLNNMKVSLATYTNSLSSYAATEKLVYSFEITD